MDLLPAVRINHCLPQGEKELAVRATSASPNPSSDHGPAILPSAGDRQQGARYYRQSLAAGPASDNNNVDLSDNRYLPRAQQRISEV